jgi:hypothetical protein
MRSSPDFFHSLFLGVLLFSATLAHAASVSGTVTDKTTGKPSVGDTVVLVDVGAGMSDAAHVTTDARGHYSMESPGAGPYLVRADHQGGSYFIAAPQSGPGDITVYDVATKVDGVSIDADMILMEAAGGMMRVQERFLVRNTSLPPRAQLSSNTFEFAIPPEAVLESAAATRPGGMATNTRPVALGQKGHYTINIPIQPNQGEKETLFELQYQLPYKGKYTFHPQPSMPADNVVAYVPKSMTFSGGTGASFQESQQDPRVQTFVAKGIHPGQAVAFTVSGEGEMPRETQGAGGQQPDGMGGGDAGNRPGGGIGVPIDTPDPLTKYKWWILGILALVLAAAAAFFLRRQRGPAPGAPVLTDDSFERRPAPVFAPAPPTIPAAAYAPAFRPGNTPILNLLKEELFAIESEKLSGEISLDEYAAVKAGLEALLKRTLKKK